MGDRAMTGFGAPPFVQVGSKVPQSPIVSASILVLERVSLAEGCLDSLNVLGAETLGVEVVVVANGTSPAGIKRLESRQDITLIRSRTNLGFAGGSNLSAEIARGDYLLFLNDDSIVEERCIEALLSLAEDDPSIGAVGSRILNSDGSLQEAGAVLWRDGSATHVGRGLPTGALAYSYVREVDYCSANGLLVRREAWEAVGGFDEDYHPAYYEDTDLCMAMRKHGYRVMYEPRARLRHLESQSTSGSYKAFLMERNRQRLAAKWAAELDHHESPPSVDDRVAVERAVQRARGTPPRLLVIDHAPASEVAPCDAHVLAAVEALGEAGWAVTFLVSADSKSAQRGGRWLSDRLAQSGVDVRDEGLDQMLALTGTDYEAVVAFAAPPKVGRIARPDGTEVPLVVVPAGQGLADQTLRSVFRVARRMPAPFGCN